MRAIWNWPRFDLERDAWIAARPGGAVVGYAWVWGPRRPHADYDGFLGLEPADSQPGVGEALLERLEARALAAAEDAGLAGRVAVVVWSSSRDAVKRELLEARGFAQVRTYYRMERLLDGPFESPRWPDEVRVSVFRRGVDDAELHDTLQEAFARHYRFMVEPLDEWSRRALDREEFAPELTFLVLHRDRAVAASCNYHMGQDGWVGILGVRDAWRHRGLATALLWHSFRAFQAVGARRACLGVDGENADNAPRLYERVGMRVTRHVHLYEKTLRPAAG